MNNSKKFNIKPLNKVKTNVCGSVAFSTSLFKGAMFAQAKLWSAIRSSQYFCSQYFSLPSLLSIKLCGNEIPSSL